MRQSTGRRPRLSRGLGHKYPPPHSEGLEKSAARIRLERSPQSRMVFGLSGLLGASPCRSNRHDLNAERRSL